MARSTTERLAEKTVERQFLYELETDFELAPAASRAILATAQQVLLVSGGEPRQGQMRLTAVSAAEPSGKPLSAMKKVSVVATVDGGFLARARGRLCHFCASSIGKHRYSRVPTGRQIDAYSLVRQ